MHASFENNVINKPTRTPISDNIDIQMYISTKMIFYGKMVKSLLSTLWPTGLVFVIFVVFPSRMTTSLSAELEELQKSVAVLKAYFCWERLVILRV